MPGHKDWLVIEVPPITALPRPVFLTSQSIPARHRFPLHNHVWDQLTYATEGLLQITVEEAWSVVTPQQAIWIPAGMRHTTGGLSDARYNSVYIAAGMASQMPQRCACLTVSPLLRALILELEAISDHKESEEYVERIDKLVVDQLHRLDKEDFCLPWPKSAMLRTISEVLYEAPDDARGLDYWAAELGVSPRTLTRRFEKEVGLSLRAWRHRLRLFRALEWLGSGRNVTGIALDLGYASTSAFSYMFRKEMGCSPTDWLKR
ncbi:helix-turn-helix transcriptional regulator [Methyloligella sp. 2.7D]|uniref:AraC family transcriptional regulator n=1 Tax=unclassified Methyloligella TaxID=2625955 RepID=UPI00157D0A03|nr:helix-turn-helix transcriptional regulator [Methyloligella sp. GL2]QKP76620.1 helix-turn-helix transcriptional regulator [Methyloligella sp. GL2]